MDVPDITVPLFPLPTNVDKVLTPGAVMSGFSELSPVRGPREVKLAKPEKFGLVSGSAVFSATVPAGPGGVFVSAATRLSGSTWGSGPRTPRIPKNGIVTLKGMPVSGFEVIGPSKGG